MSIPHTKSAEEIFPQGNRIDFPDEPRLFSVNRHSPGWYGSHERKPEEQFEGCCGIVQRHLLASPRIFVIFFYVAPYLLLVAKWKEIFGDLSLYIWIIYQNYSSPSLVNLQIITFTSIVMSKKSSVANRNTALLVFVCWSFFQNGQEFRQMFALFVAAQWFSWKTQTMLTLFLYLTLANRKDWEDPQVNQRVSRSETRPWEDEAIRWYVWHKASRYCTYLTMMTMSIL